MGRQLSLNEDPWLLTHHECQNPLNRQLNRINSIGAFPLSRVVVLHYSSDAGIGLNGPAN